jgi:uncharacterized membrane protein YidH (DUF202 family)
MFIVIRILVLTLVISYLYYFINTKILDKKVSLPKVLTIVLIINIAVYLVLGVLSYLINS